MGCSCRSGLEDGSERRGGGWVFVVCDGGDCVVCLIFDKDSVFIADLDELISKFSEDIKDLFLSDV